MLHTRARLLPVLATILAAALTGIAFFLVIRVVEVVMLRGRQSMEA